MDPEATLKDAKSHLYHSTERAECADALSNYFRWRLNGGFAPKDGDERAFTLLRKLGEVADTLSEAFDCR